MTKAEYSTLYRKARQNTGIITAQTLKKIKSVYGQAGKLAADSVQSAIMSGKSELTIGSWQNLIKQLKKGSEMICTAIEESTPEAVSRAYKQYYSIESKYILDAVRDSGADELITPKGIAAFGTRIDEKVIRALVTRQDQKGYTFSEKIWNLFDKDGLPIGVNGDYQHRIKNLIQCGLAQGRDVTEIGEDIMIYVSKGKEAVFKPGRYGELLPGTGGYRARIPEAVDWRALRLVRSELYASLQTAAVENGKMNPGCSGEFDWILTLGTKHDCICPELAKSGPYTSDKIPDYPHPNCECVVQPKLRNRESFVDDLARWVNNPESSGTDYISSWHKEYKKAA